jgi:hypothetical protein
MRSPACIFVLAALAIASPGARAALDRLGNAR